MEQKRAVRSVKNNTHFIIKETTHMTRRKQIPKKRYQPMLMLYTTFIYSGKAILTQSLTTYIDL